MNRSHFGKSMSHHLITYSLSVCSFGKFEFWTKCKAEIENYVFISRSFAKEKFISDKD